MKTSVCLLSNCFRKRFSKLATHNRVCEPIERVVLKVMYHYKYINVEVKVNRSRHVGHLRDMVSGYKVNRVVIVFVFLLLFD